MATLSINKGGGSVKYSEPKVTKTDAIWNPWGWGEEQRRKEFLMNAGYVLAFLILVYVIYKTVRK